MLLLGQEGLVSHLPGLISKKKKSSFCLLLLFLFSFLFYLEGGNSFILVLKGERCVDM